MDNCKKPKDKCCDCAQPCNCNCCNNSCNTKQGCGGCKAKKAKENPNSDCYKKNRDNLHKKK